MSYLALLLLIAGALAEPLSAAATAQTAAEAVVEALDAGLESARLESSRPRALPREG